MQRLTIGAFSRLTHLSVKTLRYYHEVGLLDPAVVDPDSGYRYYRPGQADAAHLVRRFRDLGLPVADVKAVLAAPDLTARDAILAGHLDRMREQLRQTEAAVDSLRRMLEGGPAVIAIEERTLDGGPTISVAADLIRADVTAWWWDAFASLRAIAVAAGLEQTGPVGGLYDDELFTQDAGHARVYLPVSDSPALDGTGARWELPAGRFAVAVHPGAHRDVDRTYAALGTYAAAHDRDGSGPVRERYLANPLDTPDTSQWRTEVCWPLAPARSGLSRVLCGRLRVGRARGRHAPGPQSPRPAEPPARIAIPAPEHACRYDHKTPATLLPQRLMLQPGPACAPGMRRMPAMGASRTHLRTETM